MEAYLNDCDSFYSAAEESDMESISAMSPVSPAKMNPTREGETVPQKKSNPGTSAQVQRRLSMKSYRRKSQLGRQLEESVSNLSPIPSSPNQETGDEPSPVSLQYRRNTIYSTPSPSPLAPHSANKLEEAESISARATPLSAAGRRFKRLQYCMPTSTPYLT